MEELKFRDLRADEIEVRVGMAKQNGVSLLLYKNARCDMNILDETVGANQWQRKHYECKNNLYCSVGIKFPDGWIWKDDCGAESNMEKQKGEASDAFKRACVNWGIGRELYTSPFIWIGSDACEIKQNGNKFYCKDTFVFCEFVVDKRKSDFALLEPCVFFLGNGNVIFVHGFTSNILTIIDFGDRIEIVIFRYTIITPTVKGCTPLTVFLFCVCRLNHQRLPANNVLHSRRGLHCFVKAAEKLAEFCKRLVFALSLISAL